MNTHKIAIIGLAAVACARIASGGADDLRADLYGPDPARRVAAASRLLQETPGEAMAEFARILKAPAAPFNEKLQVDLCTLLAKRADAASLDLILRKQKEDSSRALWIVEDSLAACPNRDAISRLIPGFLTNLRAADRELGFFLVGRQGLTEHKDLFVKALVQERNRDAFEQSLESAAALMKRTRIAVAILNSIDLVLGFEDRMSVSRVVGQAGDAGAVPELARMLSSESTKPLAIEALSWMKNDTGLKAARDVLAPPAGEAPEVPARDRLRGVALRAVLRFPVERIATVVSELLKPESVFLLDDGEATADSRLFVLDWLRAHPDPRFEADLEALLRTETHTRYRPAIQAALAVIKDPAATQILRADAEKGDPDSVQAFAEADATQAGPVVLAKLRSLLDAGLQTDPSTSIACITAAGQIQSPEALDLLVKTAKLETAPYSVESLKQIARFSAPEGETALEDALKSRSEEMRRAACLVLAGTGTSASLRSLDSVSRQDRSQRVRDDAHLAAAAIRARHGKGLP